MIPKIPDDPQGKYLDWVETCIDNSDRLSTWEQGFIENLSEQTFPFTDRQIEILERIYAAKTR